MNCNPCCGCLPPITTYDPSAANNFPTILQQVEYLKALLKKYPSQQWFITQEKVTEETVKLDSTKIPLRGRAIADGDFILGNAVGGTILIFQYTGAMTDLTYYVVEYVGVYSNQSEAQEALQRANGANELAGQALSLAQANEQNITSAEARITSLEAEASIEVTITPASATSGVLTDEQYTTLSLNDNCYIKLNEVVYTLSKNSATGVLIYTSKYLSDTKTVRAITVTKSTKAWVMTEVSVGGGGKLYRHTYVAIPPENATEGNGKFNDIYNYVVICSIVTNSENKPYYNISQIFETLIYSVNVKIEQYLALIERCYINEVNSYDDYLVYGNDGANTVPVVFNGGSWNLMANISPFTVDTGGYVDGIKGILAVAAADPLSPYNEFYNKEII